MDIIYFDNAATTALDPMVLEAMLPYMVKHFGNPSSSYSYGRETRMAIELARKEVANLLHAQTNEIFFTSGGTESNNTAIAAAVRDLHCNHIISSPIEHHAVLRTIEHYTRKNKAGSSQVRLLPDGHIDLDDLEKQLKYIPERCLVSLMHANNEIGNLTDIKKVGEICQKYNAIFHSDCVQTVGHYPINLAEIPVHFISGASHKFHGPKGAGILYVNKSVSVKPLLFGGGQEHSMRAGTENVYGIVGFAKALAIATERYAGDRAYIHSLKTSLMQQLKQRIPGVKFNGDAAGESLYAVLNAGFPKNEQSSSLLFNLDTMGICVSGGSACQTGSGGSHVISALPNNREYVSVRFSFSRYNTMEEVMQLVDAMAALLETGSFANTK